MKNIQKLIVFIAAIAFLISCAAKPKNKSSYMNATYKSLQKELSNADVTIVGDSIKVLFAENIMFATNSATITENFAPSVKKFAKVLNKYKNTTILVNGYTDNTGSDEINAKLSNERANNAKDALVKNNVSASRLFAWGHGPKHPIASNSTEEGRQKNRRVEFILLYDVK